jgi:endonuclease III
MKNSKEYADKITKFLKTSRGAKTHLPRYTDPVEAMIFGILSEVMAEPKARNVYAQMQENFVDWNDLRVSRLEEVSEFLREDPVTAERVTMNLTQSLNHIFQEHDSVSLAMLKEMGKRPARKFLEDMPGLSRYVIDYIMLTAVDAHSIPLTRKMLDCLRQNEFVDPSASEDDIEGFLQRQISASEAYHFYIALRKESERPVGEKPAARKLVKTAQARAAGGPERTAKKKSPARAAKKPATKRR